MCYSYTSHLYEQTKASKSLKTYYSRNGVNHLANQVQMGNVPAACSQLMTWALARLLLGTNIHVLVDANNGTYYKYLGLNLLNVGVVLRDN